MVSIQNFGQTLPRLHPHFKPHFQVFRITQTSIFNTLAIFLILIKRIWQAQILQSQWTALIMFLTTTLRGQSGFFPNAQYNNVYPGLPGDIFLNLNSQANFLPSYAPGSAGFFLAIHEIGHTLGLKHPHDDGGTGRPTFTDLGISGLDIDWATIMSYNDDANWNLVSFDPATPMPLDVLALQYLYGPNQTTNSGNSVYTLPLNNLYATIWDPSGGDTIDVSSSPVAWTIALPNVQLSELVSTLTGFALPTNDFQIAVPQNLYWLMGNIEDVIGSKYDDTLSGNDIANLLVGGEGSDALHGGDGNDTLNGGAGADQDVGRRRQRRLFRRQWQRRGHGERQRGQRHCLCLGRLQADGERREPGAARQRRAGLRQQPWRTPSIGNSGNNILNGGTGADGMYGGAGNDAYFVDNPGDVVIENANDGSDTVFATIHLRLSANVETPDAARQCRPAGLRQQPRNTHLSATPAAICSTAAPAPTPWSAGRQRHLFRRQCRRLGDRERQRGQ